MIVSERELAKHLGKERKTIAKWRLMGKIIPIRVKPVQNSFRYFYDLDAVEKVVQKFV